MRRPLTHSRALWLSVLMVACCSCGDAGPAERAFDTGDTVDADDAAIDTLALDLDATHDGIGDDASPTGAGDVETDRSEPSSDLGAPDGDEATPAPCSQCSDQRRPVILVHGINGSPANFEVMIGRLLEDGWTEEDIVAFEAEDPSWGCNVDNAAALDELVDAVLAASCQPRVDIVAHSMGTLSSRYFIKFLGGHERVNTYVTLGGMHHGLTTPCFAPDFLGVCVWTELCESGDFIEDLNDDPATPGELHWVSIHGTADDTVSNESSHLDGAENIAIEGAEHDGPNGLLQRSDSYEEVRRVLNYSCW